MLRYFKVSIAGCIAIAVLAAFAYKSDHKLAIGLYNLTYTINALAEPSKIKIANNTFCQYFKNGDSVSGKIRWIYDDIFVFDSIPRFKVEQDTSAFAALIVRSFGDPCIELQKRSDDTIFFRTTYAANLLITLNEGFFVKAKETL